MRMVNWNSTVMDGAFPGSQSASHSEKRLESTRKAVAAFHPDLDWNVMVMVMIMSINIDLLDWFLSFVSLFSFLIWFDLIFFLYWIGLMAIPRTRTRAPYRICACPISPTDRAPNPLRYKIERESSLQNRTLELIFIFILLLSLFPLVPPRPPPPQTGNGSSKERVSRSHSLKETQTRKVERAGDKDKKESRDAKDGQHTSTAALAGGVSGSVSLKQKITNVLYPDREQHDHKESNRSSSSSSHRNITYPPQSLYSALDSCLYLAAQGTTRSFHLSIQSTNGPVHQSTLCLLLLLLCSALQSECGAVQPALHFQVDRLFQ